MTTLNHLIDLSRELGQPAHDLAILGEGNTSALDGERFWVKASGSTLCGIDAGGFVALDRAATEALLDADLATDEAILDALVRVRVEGERRPSIEAMMHAFLLGLPGVNFVGHTHPASVNALLCSAKAEALASLCLFPDQIVCCGPAPVFVPYADPGLPLARLVRERVLAFIDAQGFTPKAILLQNHGLFALGATPAQVMSCTLMWQKTARVIAGAEACGGAVGLTPANIDRIFTRPDEKFREQAIGK
jgi:rhamnose utilization protein RhaD (predicted bifunctional aldolase and dehydrogenase)